MSFQENSDVWLTRQKQAARYGTCVRTIVRWGEDPDMGFPPEYEFGNRRCRSLGDLEVWERSRIRARNPSPPARAASVTEAL